MDQLHAGRHVDPFDTVWLRKDGTPVDVFLNVSPIKDAAGNIIGGSSIARDISFRKQAEQAMRASLLEKEVLLREIHHRVKNNLQVISSLLNIQAKSIHDPAAFELFRESQNRVRSIAVVHQKLHKSKDLAHIDFSEYIRDLVTPLFHTYGVNGSKVALQMDVGKILLGIDTAIPCGLIINELVTNSLKYAFPEDHKGTIGIELHATGPREYLLTVQDSGGRFPRGLDLKTTTSAGMQIVTALVKQLDGQLDLLRDGTTAFRITFRELAYRERT
jgi:two-component sensor histidine kinase